MKVAIAADNGFVSEHFGRAPEFVIAELKKGKFEIIETAANPGHSTGTIPKFLSEKGVECVIAGGAGFRAQQFFAEFGIELVTGASGSVKSVLGKLAAGTLENSESKCLPQSGRGYGIKKEDGHEK